MAEITKELTTQDFVYAPATTQPRKLSLRADFTVDDSTGEVGKWQVLMSASPVIILSKPDGSFVSRMQWNGGTMFQGRDLAGPAELRPSRPKDIQQNIIVVRDVRLHADSTTTQSQKPTERLNLDYAIMPISPPSTTAVALIACNRVSYFKQVVDALAPQVTDKPVYLFLDKPLEKGQETLVTEQKQYAASKFKLLSVIERPVNFGCGMNIIDARDKIFNTLRYERAFIFEDDMVPDANYIDYCQKLWDWSKQFTNVGAVQGWSRCFLTPAQKKRKNKEVFVTFDNAWGYLTSKECWDAIRTMMLDYSTFIKNTLYMSRDNLRLSRFMRPYKDKPFESNGMNPVPMDNIAQNDERFILDNCPTGQDGITYLAMRHAGLVRLAPTVNRGSYIGKSGIHSTPNMYNKSRLGEVLPSNISTPDSFKLRNQK